MNVAGLLARAGYHFYNYLGSETTPDCKENVNWIVMTDPIQISTAQLAAFRKLWENNQNFAGGHGNNRDPQPLHGRKVVYGDLRAFAAE